MPEPVRPARETNPDAGDYPVVTDPRDVAACGAATRASYAAYPYWEARFGARGRVFSASDSRWLVAISGEDDVDHVVRQVAWLGGVLTARGMPRILLERHLRILADELAAVRPGAGGPDRLRAAAAALEARRVKAIDAATFARLAQRFDEVTDGIDGGVPRCGDVIVGAVCDEDDVASAVPALVDWLGDPERFPPAWIAAVEDGLEAAYEARAGDLTGVIQGPGAG